MIFHSAGNLEGASVRAAWLGGQSLALTGGGRDRLISELATLDLDGSGFEQIIRDVLPVRCGDGSDVVNAGVPCSDAGCAPRWQP